MICEPHELLIHFLLHSNFCCCCFFFISFQTFFSFARNHHDRWSIGGLFQWNANIEFNRFYFFRICPLLNATNELNESTKQLKCMNGHQWTAYFVVWIFRGFGILGSLVGKKLLNVQFSRNELKTMLRSDENKRYEDGKNLLMCRVYIKFIVSFCIRFALVYEI